MRDETKMPVTFTRTELARCLGRSAKATLSAWISGERPDPLGDPYLDGEWIGRPSRKGRLYVASPERVGVLKDWLATVADLQRRAVKPPPYIERGRNRGNEYVTPDDLRTVPLNIDGLGTCTLFMRNRSWLHVFDGENSVKRVRASERLLVELTELGIAEFWPFSDEDALRLVYGLEFPKESGET